MSFETADDVLEHFGVRGMRWGVRKTKTAIKKTGRLIRKNPERTIQIVSGAAFVATLLLSARGGNITTRSLSSRANAPRVTVGARVAPKMASRSRITKSSSGDIAKMRSEIASSIKAANKELRETDNRLNIPIFQRSYISEWD